MPNEFGANDFTLEELEELFKDEGEQETPPAEQETIPSETQPATEETNNSDDSIEKTKAFAKRLSEKTEKARLEEREVIAKKLGYESYDQLMKKQEEQLLADKGLDPEEVSPVVEELVKKRIDSDPRMKELEEFRAQKVKEFGKQELAQITELTNGEITSLSQLPKEVIELWKTKGSLKAAFLEVKGEEYIRKARAEQSRGSTSHLSTPSSSSKSQSKQRPLTAEEKRVWKFFNPNMTDEELDNKLIDN